MNNKRPLQKVEYQRKNLDWYKENADFLRLSSLKNYPNLDNLEVLYKVASGDFDENEYNYVTNRFNLAVEDLKGYPSKIRNMPIITPILNVLMGEKTDRPQNASIVVKNSNFTSEYEKAEYNAVLGSLQTKFLNEYIKNNPDANLEEEPVKSPEVIAKELSSLKDEKAIEGQHVLNYVYQNSEVPRKLRKGFYDYLVTNSVFSFKFLDEYGEVDYEIVHPREIKYSGGNNIEFIEDANVVVRTTKMSGNCIIDNFRDLKDFDKKYETQKKLIDYLDSEAQQSLSMSFNQALTHYNERQKNHNEDKEREFLVEHVVWKGFKRFRTISSIDEVGEPIILENITDEYKLDEYEELIKEEWKSQNHQCYVIDDLYYIGYGEMDRIRTKMTNDSKLKLPYNGMIINNGLNTVKSMVELAIPFQIKFNIIHYQIEKLINKNKDKLMVMPIQLISDEEGFDLKTTLHYADATSFLFVDASDNKTMQALNALKSIDLSLSTYITNLLDIADYYKNQLEQLFGITQQRKGAINQNAGKAITEEAIYRGSLASEELFKRYEEFEQREGQGILDICKLAYNDGIKSSYVSSDNKINYFEINPETFSESEFGVFFDNSKKTKMILETLRSSAQAFVQNQMQPSMVAKMALIDDIPELIRELENSEKQLQENQERQQKSEQENQQLLQDKQDALQKQNFELAYYKIDQDNTTKMQINLDKIESELLGMDINLNNIDDSKEFEALSIKRQELFNKVNLEREKLRTQKQISDDKIMSEKYKADTSLKIAKENKNKFNK